MSQSDSNVVVITPQHAYSGRLDFGEARLSEILNDRRETVIRVQDITISLMDKPSQVIARHSEAVIPKQLAAIVFEQQVHSIRPDKRLYSYVKKKEHRVHMVVDGIEIEGYLHTLGNLDLKRIVSAPEQLFVPITRPVLSFRSGTHYVFKPNTVMVNTSHIQYIAAVPEKPAESNAPAPKGQESTQA
jgi:hypothetical protein